jgi:flagellar protein FliJ
VVLSFAKAVRGRATGWAAGVNLSMKSRNTLIRSKKFQLDEKRRKVAQMEAMIADFQRMAADLEREIVAEQERAGIHDPSHFAYPTYAKAAMARRENLKRSIDELAAQLSGAKIALAESAEELKRVELLDQRDQSRDRAAEEGREQAQLDALAAMRARGALA